MAESLISAESMWELRASRGFPILKSCQWGDDSYRRSVLQIDFRCINIASRAMSVDRSRSKKQRSIGGDCGRGG